MRKGSEHMGLGLCVELEEHEMKGKKNLGRVL